MLLILIFHSQFQYLLRIFYQHRARRCSLTLSPEKRGPNKISQVLQTLTSASHGEGAHQTKLPKIKSKEKNCLRGCTGIKKSSCGGPRCTIKLPWKAASIVISASALLAVARIVTNIKPCISILSFAVVTFILSKLRERLVKANDDVLG